LLRISLGKLSSGAGRDHREFYRNLKIMHENEISEKVIVDLKAKDKLSPNLAKPEFQISSFKLQIYNNSYLSKRNSGQVCDLCPTPAGLSLKTLFKLGITNKSGQGV
jgi:hypothetical protein